MSDAEANVPKPQEGPDPLIGTMINERFKITGVIARGGMGKVYKGEQQALGRVCAIKVLDAKYTGDQDAEFHKRFFLEASISAKLTHPNTVTIFDYGRTDANIYYMAMEYLEGRTLSKAIKTEGPFTEERALFIMRQICRSLREAHALGVIHRDLKPANVYLIEHSDDKDYVKVLDFGLVKNVGDDKSEELTQTGLFMGSPKYMAPEQIRGEHVDARTDIYALGVILYEMVTGKVPFDRPNTVNILMAHVNEPVPPPRSLRPDLSESIEEIIMKCLEKRIDARYASMEEMLSAFKRDGLPTTTGALERTGNFDALSASGSFTPQPLIDPLRGSTGALAANADLAQPKSKKPIFIGAAALVLVVVGVAVALTRKDQPAAAAKDPPKVEESKEKPAAKASEKVESSAAVAAPSPSPVEAAKPVAAKISVTSDPPGAKVRDDKKVTICDATPCTVTVDGASMTLMLELDGYSPETIRLSRDDSARTVKLAKKGPAYVAPPGGVKPPPGDKPPSGWKKDPFD